MSQQQQPVGQQANQIRNAQQPQTQGYQGGQQIQRSPQSQQGQQPQQFQQPQQGQQPQQFQQPQHGQQPQQFQQPQQGQQPQQYQQSQGIQQPQQFQGQGSPITQASFPTRNVLPEGVRSESVAALNQSLADATVLRTQCKTAHWNVKGPDFYQLHELFDDIAEMLEGYVDELAERATALGGLAGGTAPVAARNAQLPEFQVTATDERTVLEGIADSLAAFDATLQAQIRDASAREDLDTADLLNELSRDVSKSLWFVEAHLQGEAT